MGMTVETRHLTVSTPKRITLNIISDHFKKHLKKNEHVIRWAIIKAENNNYLIEFAVVVDIT